jgi:hypothetical protein
MPHRDPQDSRHFRNAPGESANPDRKPRSYRSLLLDINQSSKTEATVTNTTASG